MTETHYSRAWFQWYAWYPVRDIYGHWHWLTTIWYRQTITIWQLEDGNRCADYWIDYFTECPECITKKGD